MRYVSVMCKVFCEVCVFVMYKVQGMFERGLYEECKVYVCEVCVCDL